MTAEQQLELAKKHLLRVQEAWDPPRWDDLSLYGFYCLENAVTAAATHANITFKRTHPGKADAARQLARAHALPNVEDLLKDLNDARKSEAYGDVAAPELDAETSFPKSRTTWKRWKHFLGRRHGEDRF